MKRWTKRMTPIVGLVTVGALVTAFGAGGRPSGGGDAAAATASETGITETSVTIGATFPLTGVAAPGYSEIPTGTQAYFDYVNAAGGVHGRQIDYIVRDDGYNPTTTSQVTNEFVFKDGVFAMLSALGTPTHRAVVDFLNGEKVPDLLVASGSRQWGDDPEAKPYTFGWQPDYEIEGKIVGEWVAQNMPDAKVGLFLQDDDLGEDSEKGLRPYIEDQIVEVQRYTSGNTDVAPQITALEAAGADLVLGFNVPSYTALSQLAAMKLNYDPQWFYANIGSDPALIGSLLSNFSKGAVAEANPLDGALTTEYMPGVDATDNAWVKLWQKVWDEHGEAGELTNYRIFGMSAAYTFVQALQAAGENPTREGIVDAMEKMGGAAVNPSLAPYRYSADSHLGISGMRIVEINDGASDPLTPVLVTDLGDTPIEEDGSAADDGPPASGIPESAG